jgi:hypothetical protein
MVIVDSVAMAIYDDPLRLVGSSGRMNDSKALDAILAVRFVWDVSRLT